MSFIDMSELGGYFELELGGGEHYHRKAVDLNSARNCFKYILKAQSPRKIYVPAYCCDSLIEPLTAESIEYSFYHVDDDFELTEHPELKEGERLLYINYFALKSDYVKTLQQRYGEQLIIDNTQAFFEMPIKGVDTFYSPRKFFGVSDGGYLYTKHGLDKKLEQGHSAGRFIQLLGRYEQTATAYYAEYQKSEGSLIDQPIKRMSKLTQGILKSLDYEKFALIRQRNFWALHSVLKSSNQFGQIEISDFVPMVYPYLTDETSLRGRLIENKIYVAKYWVDAIERLNEHEKNMFENVVFLPVDQRVSVNDIQKILKVIKSN